MTDPTPSMPDPDLPRPGLADRASDAALRGLLGLGRMLPYRRRVPLTGWMTAHLVAPLAGWRGRIRDNLAHVWPDLPEAELRRMLVAVPDNIGRTVAELYSGQEFVDRVRAIPLEGPGAATLAAAHEAQRPVVLVTGHFGNYDVARAALIARGYRVGGLYKPMKNRLFDAHYIRAISSLGEPLFPRGSKGLAGMVRFLRSGGMLGIVVDQHMMHGLPLTFFGQVAMTATSAADLALKYDALLVPIYGIRQPDGLSFRIRVEAPVPPGTPAEMTQALNDSLEAQVRAHPGQWFWVHRRWKGPGGKRGWSAIRRARD
ncbi:lysophospholipid acyltransferase family protein [Frigidibacter oleivorans]|uniref:lysophospholipid acyltransferase family protein n=1 Tax=Frigidibacter oleivorans TaxID=2487129 RepID=UPI0038B416A5